MILNNITLRLGQSESELKRICEKKLRAKCAEFHILRKSLDARDKSDIKWVYSVECSEKPQKKPARVFEKISKPMPRVYIAGAGPAGLFCALRLMEYGIKPVIIDRGNPCLFYTTPRPRD